MLFVHEEKVSREREELTIIRKEWFFFVVVAFFFSLHI